MCYKVCMGVMYFKYVIINYSVENKKCYRNSLKYKKILYNCLIK